MKRYLEFMESMDDEKEVNLTREEIIRNFKLLRREQKMEVLREMEKIMTEGLNEGENE